MKRLALYAYAFALQVYADVKANYKKKIIQDFSRSGHAGAVLNSAERYLSSQ